MSVADYQKYVEEPPLNSRLSLVNKIKSRFVEKFGRDASPAIDRCCSTLVQKGRLRFDDIEVLEH